MDYSGASVQANEPSGSFAAPQPFATSSYMLQTPATATVHAGVHAMGEMGSRGTVEPWDKVGMAQREGNGERGVRPWFFIAAVGGGGNVSSGGRWKAGVCRGARVVGCEALVSGVVAGEWGMGMGGYACGWSLEKAGYVRVGGGA